MTRELFTIQGGVAGADYDALLDLCVSWKTRVLLVVREHPALTTKGAVAVDSLAPYLLLSATDSSWPGMTLTGEPATPLRYVLDATTAGLLKSLARDLFAWRAPHLPQDLCILRSDDSPLLVTIAEEEDACLEVTKEELAAIRERIPGLAAKLVKEKP